MSNTTPSPWHDGELTLQRSANAVERMYEVGQKQIARDWMPDQHREFYNQLPFVVLGAVDDQGAVWATIRTGQPGFMHSPEPRTLTMQFAPDAGDPAQSGLNSGDALGMIGMELHTRRRNRMNALIEHGDEHGLTLRVQQAYGNCPRYISLRQYRFVDEPAGPVETLSIDHPDVRRMITTSDSFYVASYVVRDGVRQVDASHRGGKPGFVHMADDGTLTVPDFNGNLFFNTLGNFLLNPQAGLLFVDFETGDVLQLHGSAEVVLEAPEIAAFQGVERLWRVKPQRVIRRRAAINLRWEELPDGASPNSLMTGSWEQAQARLEADALRKEWRPYRVARADMESASIRSLYLEPADGRGVPGFKAGQHLPVRVAMAGKNTPVSRMYSVSSAPSDGYLRISVKRDGAVSSHLHDGLKVGDLIEARAPQGHFSPDLEERRPMVLLAAGVGITPLLSMLREAVYQGRRMQRKRPIWLIQSARSKAELAFTQELDELAAANIQIVRVLSQPEGETEWRTGRITAQLLTELLPFNDYDFYLCGPGSFTQQLYAGLRGLRIADDRIHAETFGPSTLVRDVEQPAAATSVQASEPVKVMFAASEKQAEWAPGSGTLLELAEAQGLSPAYGCRAGACGDCKARLNSGKVHYLSAPQAPLEEGEVLICCATPAQSDEPFSVQV